MEAVQKEKSPSTKPKNFNKTSNSKKKAQPKAASKSPQDTSTTRKPKPAGPNKHKSSSSNKLSKDYNFPAMAPSNMADKDSPIARLLKKGNSSTVTGKDGHFTMTDYLDWKRETDSPVLSYTFETNTNLLAEAATSSLGMLLAYVKGVEVYVYPRSVNAENSSQFAGVSTIVPSLLTADAAISYLNMSTTIVKPTFMPNWVKVLHYRSKDLFDTNIRPYTAGTKQTLFRMTVFDPDTLESLTTNGKIQLKVVTHLSQGFATSIKQSLRVQYLADFDTTETGSSGTWADEPVFMNFKGVAARNDSHI